MPTKKLTDVRSPANDRFAPKFNWATQQMDDPVDKMPSMKPMASHPQSTKSVSRPIQRATKGRR